jgi:hypothetical protein
MTAIVLKSLKLPKFLFATWIIGHLTAVGKAIRTSRQCSANEVIARQLLHEYPNHTYHSLLAELNRTTIQGEYNDK